MDRPKGSNADEWAMFLDEWSGANDFLAVQIAEAIEEAERRGMPYREPKVMVCGVDCHPGDENCNGHCRGLSDEPPPYAPSTAQ